LTKLYKIIFMQQAGQQVSGVIPQSQGQPNPQIQNQQQLQQLQQQQQQNQILQNQHLSPHGSQGCPVLCPCLFVPNLSFCPWKITLGTTQGQKNDEIRKNSFIS